MRDEDTIVRERQLAIRRVMIAQDISPTTVAMIGEWKTPSTVLSHFPNPDGGKEPATMSVATLYRLLKKKALPASLLSTLLPDGFVIVQVPEGVDYDRVSEGCREFIAAKDRAHHPESEAGRDIGPNESADLSAKVVRLRA